MTSLSLWSCNLGTNDKNVNVTHEDKFSSRCKTKVVCCERLVERPRPSTQAQHMAIFAHCLSSNILMTAEHTNIIITQLTTYYQLILYFIFIFRKIKSDRALKYECTDHNLQGYNFVLDYSADHFVHSHLHSTNIAYGEQMTPYICMYLPYSLHIFGNFFSSYYVQMFSEEIKYTYY